MKGRRWLLAACLAFVGVLLLAVFPGQTYFEQRGHQEQAAANVRALEQQNQELEGRVQHLQTDAEVERLAREQFGLVRPGEEVYAVVGPPASSPPPPPPLQPVAPDKSWWEKALDFATSIF